MQSIFQQRESFFSVIIIIIVSILILMVLDPFERTDWPMGDLETRIGRLWKLIELLILPGILVFTAYFLNRRQHLRAQLLAKQQQETAQAIAQDQFEETVLQRYFDQMARLLLREQLRQAEPNSEVAMIARARTIAVLPRLNGIRKGIILQFLYESHLINTGKRIINLQGANLQQANLKELNLAKAELIEVRLDEAVLTNANLTQACLNGAFLVKEAKLKGTILVEADLRNAYLNGADLAEANLTEANLERAYLIGAKLNKAQLTGANLVEARLNEADLTGADLTNAVLTKVDLTRAVYDDTTQWPDNFNPARATTENYHRPAQSQI